jgi:hypothetical protein
MSAEISVDSLRFKTVFDSLKTVGGGTMSLTTDMPVRIAKSTTYALESDLSNPINIKANQFKIIAIGDGTSADSCFLRVGNNVNISGTNIVLSDYKRGHIRIVGGSVTSNTTTPGSAAIFANDGWVFISGGTVSVNATGLTTGNYAFAVNTVNYMALSITGGTISATGDNTRAVTASDYGNGFLKPISGATLTASGSGVYGLEVLGVSGTPMTIGNNLTINTSSTDGTDVAIVNSGSTSLLIIPATVSNLAISATTSFKQVNTSSVLFDLRGVSITANPVTGSTLTYPSNNVALTATGNSTMTNAGIYYAYSATPTTVSPNITSGASVVAGAATVTIKASIGKLGFIDSNVYSFTYTVNNLPANTPINVTTFADLQAAYTTSQTATVDTTRIVLLGNVTNTTAFTMTPDALHPVVINASGFQLITGANLTLGGALRVYSSTTTGILKISGAFTTTISGGTYTVYGNTPIIYANSGSGVSNTLTNINLSNATFNANGTTSASSIVKFATNNGNALTATNCTFNLNAKGIAFNLLGLQTININTSTLNINGSDPTSEAFYQAVAGSGVQSKLTISGLTLNMNAGPVFTWGGALPVYIIIKDLILNGAATLAKPSGSTATTQKFYDFRALTTDVAPGGYLASQNVTLSMGATAVDAAGAAIYYTLDGTTPTVLSSLFVTTPISVAVPTTINAIAVKDAITGNSKSFVYTIGNTGVNSVGSDNGLSIYPTVVENMVTVSKMAKHIQVVDLAGKLMLEKTNTAQFDMSTIKSGVYLVKVESTDNTTKTIKVVKL